MKELKKSIYRIDYAADTVYKYYESQKAFLYYGKISMISDEEMEEIEANNEE